MPALFRAMSPYQAQGDKQGPGKIKRLCYLEDLLPFPGIFFQVSC